MMEQSTQSEVAFIAELNDLLHLEHDAQLTYATAIKQIENEAYRRSLEEFKGDHDRHLTELTALIRVHGGMPMEFPHPESAPAKLATQAAGGLGGDRATLLAFKANERLSRDKYRRASGRGDFPGDVGEFLRRAAADEARHYSWALETLDELGAGEGTPAGRAARAFETVHTRTADVMENAGKQIAKAFEGARRGTQGVRAGANGQLQSRPLGTVLVAVGAGYVAARLLSRR